MDTEGKYIIHEKEFININTNVVFSFEGNNNNVIKEVEVMTIITDLENNSEKRSFIFTGKLCDRFLLIDNESIVNHKIDICFIKSGSYRIYTLIRYRYSSCLVELSNSDWWLDPSPLLIIIKPTNILM